MAKTSYAIALGSNRRSRHGSPTETLRYAAAALGVDRLSTIRSTPALGPRRAQLAPNAAAILSSDLAPTDLLHQLKELERQFGRRAPAGAGGLASSIWI